MQEITTAELALEPLTVAHADAMFEVLSDPEIYRYLDYPPPPSVEHLRSVYQRVVSRRPLDGGELWLNWAVCPHGQSPAGYVQATVLPDGRAWIGYVLSSRYWGRGYAQQATTAMLDHLRSFYRVDRFLATVETTNHRSIRLLERLRFERADTLESARHRLSSTEELFVR